MITRIWHGYTTPERADEYEALLKAEVIQGIEAKTIPGFRGIDVLRRPMGDEVEFVTVMEFDDLDSVKAFVGEDYEQAYVPDEARAVLSRFDDRSQHYEVRDSRTYTDTAAEDQAFDEAASAALIDQSDARGASYVVDDDATVTKPMAAQVPIAAAPTTGTGLASDMWFVKKNRGQGSVPVTREGYRVAARFVFGMVGWLLVAVVMAVIGHNYGPPWLTYAALPVFVVGTLLTAWYFIATARKHTDYSITYSDFMNMRRGSH